MRLSKRSLSVLLPLIAGLLLPARALPQEYWLVIGSYRQGPGGKPVVSGITSPSLYSIPMQSLEQCQHAGRKITRDIYTPVWNFDNRWTCINNGL